MLRMIPLGGLLLVALLVAPVVAVAGGQVNAFIYHRFDEPRYASTNISSEIFAEQLAYLKAHDYRVLSLGEVARRLAAGEELPEKGAALCVDDAFTSFAEVAMPLLRQYGYPVTLFVNTDAVGTPGYLSWEALRRLEEEGVEIANHTATHDYLVERQPEETLTAYRGRIQADIARAQQALFEHLGVRAEMFAYPYGEYSPLLVQLVKEFGFQAAFAQQSGVIHQGAERYSLPRFPMGGPYATLQGFVSKLQMKPLAVTEERPESPLVEGNPPELHVKIDSEGVRLAQVNCFVQGENRCQVVPLAGRPGWFRVVAERPLSGRRNKYTLTAPGQQGGWHWYSHLWIRAERPAVPEQ